MGKSNVTVKSNRFDPFSDHCKHYGAELVEEVANAVEDHVWAVWGWTSIPIKTDTSGMGRRMLAIVSAGNRGRFYAGFLEFGTVGQAPQPAMTEAAENERAYFLSMATQIERGFRE